MESLLKYLEQSVASASWWAEACLDPEDDCPAFRDVLRAILRDAITICKTALHEDPSSEPVLNSFVSLLGAAYGASFVDIHEVNEHLQQLRHLLQVEIAKASKEGMTHADAQAATTDRA